MLFEGRSTMSLREEVCRLALRDGANRRQLAERFGITAPTLQKWLDRFVAEGAALSTAAAVRIPAPAGRVRRSKSAY